MSNEPSPMEGFLAAMKAAFDAACKEHGVQPAEAGLHIFYQHALALAQFGMEPDVLMNTTAMAILKVHQDPRVFNTPQIILH